MKLQFAFSVLIVGLSVSCVFARSFQTGHFVMTLTDNESRPITNATVYVKTLNRTGLAAGAYDSHYTTFSAMTDTNGVADVSFQFLTSHFDWWVYTPSHHSKAVGFKSDFLVSEVVKSDYWDSETNTVEGLVRYNELKALDEAGDYVAYVEKFEPKSVTYVSNTVHKSLSFYPKRNPQPMYVYGDMCGLDLPTTKEISTNGAIVVSQYSTVAIDLKNGIVIRQEQSGLEEDFRLERYAVETNGVKNFYGRMVFKPGCGAYKGIKGDDPSFPSLYEADVSRAYLPEIEFSTVRHSATRELISVHRLLEENEYLVMRTRMSVGDNGQTNGWHYSKILGPISIRTEFVFEQSVFNPRFNDPNLEFDVKENLAGSRGQSRWP